MKITITSVPVKDQQQALDFYTQKLGFVKKEDSPLGEHRWLTVISPEGAEGVELLLEPMAFEPARDYQQALYSAGIHITTFETCDLESEVSRLKVLNVNFKTEPQDMGSVKMAVIDDTCGNYIGLIKKTHDKAS